MALTLKDLRQKKRSEQEVEYKKDGERDKEENEQGRVRPWQSFDESSGRIRTARANEAVQRAQERTRVTPSEKEHLALKPKLMPIKRPLFRTTCKRPQTDLIPFDSTAGERSPMKALFHLLFHLFF